MVSSTNVVGHILSSLGCIQPIGHRLDLPEKQSMDFCVERDRGREGSSETGHFHFLTSRCSDLTFSKLVFVSEAGFHSKCLFFVFSAEQAWAETAVVQSLCVPAFVWLTKRGTLPGRPHGDGQSFSEQLAIVFSQKVPMPSQI